MQCCRWHEIFVRHDSWGSTQIDALRCRLHSGDRPNSQSFQTLEINSGKLKVNLFYITKWKTNTSPHDWGVVPLSSRRSSDQIWSFRIPAIFLLPRYARSSNFLLFCFISLWFFFFFYSPRSFSYQPVCQCCEPSDHCTRNFTYGSFITLFIYTIVLFPFFFLETKSFLSPTPKIISFYKLIFHMEISRTPF